MSKRYFNPYCHNGRWLGRWLGMSGIALERLGLWVQKWSAEVQWRRLRG